MIIFEKVQSMHQAQSPQQRCMKENHWKQVYKASYGKTLLFWKTHSIKAKNMHLKACQQLRGGKAFLTRASHKKRRQSPNSVLSNWGGREGPSLIFVFYTAPSWQIRYSAFEKYKTAGWDKYSQNGAVPGWRRMLLWIRLQISDWTFRFKMWEPTSTKNWHTHIDLPFYPSNSQLTNLFCISRLDEHCNKYFCFQHKQESTKKRTGRPRCQSNSVQAS